MAWSRSQPRTTDDISNMNNVEHENTRLFFSSEYQTHEDPVFNQLLTLKGIHFAHIIL